MYIYMLQIFLSLYIYIEKKIDHISYGSYGYPTFAWPRQARAFEEVIERFYQRYPNQSLGATFSQAF